MSSDWSFAFTQDESEYGDGQSLMSSEYKSRDACVFLVDCSPEMFEENKDGEVLFENAINLINHMIKQKIIASQRDVNALVLYNTQNKKNPLDAEGIYVHTELAEPSADMVKQIRNLAEDKKNFDSDYGSTNASDGEFYKALWVSSGLLTEVGLKNAFTRILVFTCHPDPDFNNADKRSKSVQKAADLSELNVTLTLIPLIRSGLEFDITEFWQDVIEIDETEGLNAQELYADNYEALLSKVRSKIFKKRALGSVPFSIGKDTNIGIKMYCTARRCEKESGSWLDAKTNTPLTCLTQWLCQDTGVVLEDYQIGTYFPYGGEKILLSKEEMKTVKDFGDPGLTLMGFKPESVIAEEYNIKPAYFLYPDDTQFKGSSTAFNALIISLKKLKKVAIARFIFRKGTVPRFAALVPQLERTDDYGRVEQGPGMWMIFLPYADDIRDLTVPPAAKADSELILKAKKVIKELEVGYFNEAFQNPVLQKHYSVLQALALDEELPDLEEDDDLMPDQEGMQAAEKYIKAFKTELGVDVDDDDDADMDDADEEKPKPSPSRKRKRAPSEKKNEAVKKESNASPKGRGRRGRSKVKKEEQEYVEEEREDQPKPRSKRARRARK